MMGCCSRRTCNFPNARRSWPITRCRARVDNNSNLGPFSLVSTLNPFNPSADGSYSNFDVRNSFNLSAITNLPLGFKFNPILIARSGLPYTPVIGFDTQLDGNDWNDRAIVGGKVVTRNSARQPWFFDWDIRFVKDFKLKGEGRHLDLFMDIFNLTGAGNRNFGPEGDQRLRERCCSGLHRRASALCSRHQSHRKRPPSAVHRACHRILKTRWHDRDVCLVFVSAPMALLAQFAGSDRLGVAHVMLDRLERVKISEHGLQIAVIEVLVDHDRHDGTELLAIDLSGADHLHKEIIGVIDDAGRVGRDVRAGDIAPWAGEGHVLRRNPCQARSFPAPARCDSRHIPPG